MTKTEIQALQNVIERLKQPNCGCSNGCLTRRVVEQANALGIEAVSRIYLDTWIVPALQLLLPGPERDPELAEELSR